MPNGLLATAAVNVQASGDKVWSALTDPAQIKEYLFGTEATSDWHVGSPITYKGVWEGKEYEDKGTILEAEPGRKLVSTYWSGMSGKEDKPENYVVVTYELHEQNGATELVVTQDGNADDEARQHATANWNMVLDGLKKLLESSP